MIKHLSRTYTLHSAYTGANNKCSDSVSFILCFRGTPFGVSRVVCGAHLHLLPQRAKWLVSQWILRWWRFSGIAARKALPCAHPLMLSTSLDRPQVPLFKSSHDPTRIRTHPTSFGGLCSTVSVSRFSNWSICNYCMLQKSWWTR